MQRHEHRILANNKSPSSDSIPRMRRKEKVRIKKKSKHEICGFNLFFVVVVVAVVLRQCLYGALNQSLSTRYLRSLFFWFLCPFFGNGSSSAIHNSFSDVYMSFPDSMNISSIWLYTICWIFTHHHLSSSSSSYHLPFYQKTT